MSKINTLKKKKASRPLIEPKDLIEPTVEKYHSTEEDTPEEKKTSTTEDLPNTTKRTKRRKSSDTLLEEYNNVDDTEDLIKKGYMITTLQYKKINVLSELFSRRTGKKINVSAVVRNALDAYLDKTYQEFIKSAPPNPFDE